MSPINKMSSTVQTDKDSVADSITVFQWRGKVDVMCRRLSAAGGNPDVRESPTDSKKPGRHSLPTQVNTAGANRFVAIRPGKTEGKEDVWPRHAGRTSLAKRTPGDGIKPVPDRSAMS